MQTAIQNIHTWLDTLSRIWKKQAGPSDFVWLARFRLLTIYVILKSGLVLIAGVASMSIKTTISPSTFHLLLWTITALSICAIALLLFLGLGLASKPRPRHTGIMMLFLADVCVLLAVMYACILGSLYSWQPVPVAYRANDYFVFNLVVCGAYQSLCYKL